MRQIDELLLNGAVKFGENSFECKPKKVLGIPSIRQWIVEDLQDKIYGLWLEADSPSNFAIIAVNENAVPWAAMVASDIVAVYPHFQHEDEDEIDGLPFGWVDADKVLQGISVDSDISVILVADVILSGATALAVAEKICNTGAKVIGVVSIMSHDFHETEQTFALAKVPVKKLVPYKQLIATALLCGLITTEQRSAIECRHASLQEWRK